MVGVADGKVVAVTSFDERASFTRGGYLFKYGDRPISGHEPAYGCANYYHIPGVNFVAYYDGKTLIGFTVRDESFSIEHSVYAGYRTNYAAVRDGEETEARYITNALRAKNGLKELKPLDMLREFTRAKSDDMAKHNYVSHTDSDGSNVMLKFEKKMEQMFAGTAGYYEGYCNNNTENITAGSADALQAVMSIYSSDLHRAWMLDNYGEFQYDYMELSLSFTDNAKYHVYWTQGLVSDPNKLI